MPDVLTRLRLLGLTGATGSVQLAANLSGQASGFIDTIVLNTPYLVYGDNTVLGGGGTPVGGALQIGGSPQFDMRNQPFPGTPGWKPPAVIWNNQTQSVPIASNQYLPIVVDPDSGYTEEIWLTAFVSATSTTSTWTGTRGAGSSTGAPAHTSGAVVWNAPTPFDISPTLLSSVVLATATPSVTFSSIPGTFNHLQLVAVGRTSEATESDTIYMQLNTDTAAHYDFVFIYNSSSSAAAAFTGAGDAYVAVSTFPSANATANVTGTVTIDLPVYAGTTFQKTGKFAGGYLNLATGTSDSQVSSGMFTWRSTAAITSIKIYPAIGPSFVTGSAFYLYGIT